MVFSSLPAYLDPSNWQQQQNHQTGISGGSSQFLPPLSQQTAPLLLPPPQTTDGGGSNNGNPGSIRPGSMSDRARMANIPMPEVALKCPRCESTNTKFCYFNNYSLSQPRHFCKTCRRYWTRGGALRSVPVGGGCRRNKRNKGSSSKSPVSSERQTSSGSTTSAVNSSGTTSTGTPSLLGLSPQIPPLRFMPPLSQFADYLSGHDIGLNYGGIPATSDMNFHLGNLPSLGGGGGSGGGGVSYLSATGGGVNDQWRLHPGQISSFAGMDFSSGFYPFHHQQQGGGLDLSGGYNGGPGGGSDGSNVRPKLSPSSSSLGLTQAAGSVKTEGNGNNQELNLLSRQLMGIQGNDQQYWNNNGNNNNNNNNNSSPWATDLSGFSSSSTTNQL